MRFPVLQLMRGGLDADNGSGVDVNGLAANGTTFVVGITPPAGPNNLNFWPASVYFAIVTVTSLVTRPTVSLGVVGPNFTDIMPATALTAIAAVGDYIKLPIAAPSKALPGGSSVTCRITSTGSAGALTLRPALEGYFR